MQVLMKNRNSPNTFNSLLKMASPIDHPFCYLFAKAVHHSSKISVQLYKAQPHQSVISSVVLLVLIFGFDFRSLKLKLKSKFSESSLV